MKKKFLLYVLSLITVLSFAFAVGCTNANNIIDEPEEKVITMLISKEEVKLEKHEDVSLQAIYDGEVISMANWESSDKAVATVEDGKVLAVSKGISIITATYEGSSAICKITVTDTNQTPGIVTNVSTDTLCLLVGDEFELNYSVYYNEKVLTDATTSIKLDCESGAVKISGNKIIAQEESSEAGVVTVLAQWRGLECKYVFEVLVVSSASARLSDKTSLSLCNDEKGGEVEVQFNPELIINDEYISAKDYTITNWEYDEKIVEIDKENLTVKGLFKGETEVRATFVAKEGEFSITCSLPVSVNLYSYDMSQTVLDTVYLDQSEYVLFRNQIYNNISNDNLIGTEINSIIDVTESITYEVEIGSLRDNGDMVLKIPKIKDLGVSGERKWKIDCGKYSYIVTVPLVEKYPGGKLFGTYTSSDWDYQVRIGFIDNKEKLEFLDKKTGAVVDTGKMEVTGALTDGSASMIKITTESTAISSTKDIMCLTYFSSGRQQLNLILNVTRDGNGNVFSGQADINNYKVLYSGEEQSIYKKIAGEFKNNNFAYSFVINEDLTCELKSVVGEVIKGTYVYNAGDIVLMFEKDVDGQMVFEGTIDATNLSVGIDGGSKMTFNREVVDGEQGAFGGDYEKFAGFYKGRVHIRLDTDGTFIFSYIEGSGADLAKGTYTMKDGVIKVSITTIKPGGVSAFYKGNYEGTYYEQSGRLCIDINIKYSSIYEMLK